jgi:hypothetical protein
MHREPGPPCAAANSKACTPSARRSRPATGFGTTQRLAFDPSGTRNPAWPIRAARTGAHARLADHPHRRRLITSPVTEVLPSTQSVESGYLFTTTGARNTRICRRERGFAGWTLAPMCESLSRAAIITHRGRHGGSTSSITKATFGLRRALWNFRLRAKSRPPMSIASSAADDRFGVAPGGAAHAGSLA